MSKQRWFYSQGDEKSGPVSDEELVQLASDGTLQASDLVWHDGLDDWQPASKVKGLFRSVGPANTPASRALETPADPTPSPSPAPTASSSAYSAPQEATRPLSYSRRASRDENQNLGPFTDKIWDAILDMAREVISTSLLKAASRAMMIVGGYALLFSTLVGLLFAVSFSIKMKMFSPLLVGLSGALFIIAFQYSASRLMTSVENLIASTPTTLASKAFPDSFAFLASISGIVYFTWSLANVMKMRDPNLTLLIYSTLVFITLQFIAGISLNLPSLNIVPSPGAPAGDEAYGVLAFLLKIFLRLIPFWYGIGAIAAAVTSLIATGQILAGQEYARPATLSMVMAYFIALGSASLPYTGYILGMMIFLLLDVARSILAIPVKLSEMTQK